MVPSKHSANAIHDTADMNQREHTVLTYRFLPVLGADVSPALEQDGEQTFDDIERGVGIAQIIWDQIRLPRNIELNIER